LKLSVREAAADAGVPVATFSRVENGRMPDLGTFRRLVAWIGVPPETFFEATEAVTNTPAAIAEHLHADPALDPEAAERIASIVEELYSNLVSRDRRVAMHLRAAKTFTPLALQSLTGILDDLQRGLEKRYAR
jgi:transcriptional regulator with XRE-family HTH domain